MRSQALRSFLPLFILSLTTGCYQDYYDFRGSSGDPTAKANMKNVELYFADDTPSDKEFIKIAVIRVSGKKDETYEELVDKLRERSAILGYDAVIRIIKGVSTETNTSFLDMLAASEGEKYTANTLTGYGIRYLKNMESITRYKKAERVYSYPAAKLLDRATFQLNGEFEKASPETDEPVYQKYIRPYSLDYLVNEKEHWSYKVDELGKVVSRRHVESGTILERCQFQYNDESKIVGIKVNFRKKVEAKYSLDLSYDAKGNLAQKIVEIEKDPFSKEVFHYDDQGRLHHTDVFLYADKVYTQTYRIDYEYFSIEDLKALKVDGGFREKQY